MVDLGRIKASDRYNSLGHIPVALLSSWNKLSNRSCGNRNRSLRSSRRSKLLDLNRLLALYNLSSSSISSLLQHPLPVSPDQNTRSVSSIICTAVPPIMAQLNHTNTPPEVQNLVYNEVFNNPVQRPCSNGVCCLVSFRLQSNPSSTTSIMLSVDRRTRNEIIRYLFLTFDVYLISDQVTVCLQRNSQHLYLQPLLITPSVTGIFTFLTEIWIVAGQFSFQNFSNIIPHLGNLQRVNLEHDMTNERIFQFQTTFVVEYCSAVGLYHYPRGPARCLLISESRRSLILRYQPPVIDQTPANQRDLRWFLSRPQHRVVPGVQLIVHLRCPMRLCDTCAQGGSSPLFNVFEKKMVSRV